MATSSIPAAVAALVSACQAAPALSGVKIFDGPRVTDNDLVNPDRLYVGDSVDAEPAVVGEQDFAQLGGQTRDETFSIVLTAEAWKGDPDMAARRSRAFAMMAAVENLLRPPAGDMTLAGTVLWAHVAGGIAVDQTQSDRGSVCSVTFRVACRARI